MNVEEAVGAQLLIDGVERTARMDEMTAQSIARRRIHSRASMQCENLAVIRLSAVFAHRGAN